MRTTTRIHPARLRTLNRRGERRGRYVLYWMQQSQRAEHNEALEYAVQRANALHAPLLVGFGLTDDYPEANRRHYAFMLEGLRETQTALARRGVRMVVRRGHPAGVALELAAGAALLVCDRGYLRHEKAWRRWVAEAAGCRAVQVECDTVVPVETASGRAETAARTLRPRLRRHWPEFLVGLRPTPLARDSLELDVAGLALEAPGEVLDTLRIDHGVAPDPHLQGGTRAARRLLRQFLAGRLSGYARQRSQPHTDHVSRMASYLHFGQISPLWLALAVRDARGAPQVDRDAFLEELLVRRELARNFVHFTRDYDRFSCLPHWARRTLAEHRRDARARVYTRRELEQARTHDRYWNACMDELRLTGYMHNHMRMYWGKKILEWTRTPAHAYRVTLALNNRYFLDGRDPSSYANVGWVFGLHDRPWPERPIFGKVRCMTAGGLERKTDPEAYVRGVRRRLADLPGA